MSAGEASVKASLPLVDEHTIDVAASTDEVWSALLHRVDGGFSGSVASAYARIVGCADRRASGPRPLAEGATIVGFRVARADPGRTLVLEGRHHFSTYALTFHLDPLASGSTRVRAETRARFPGLHGRAYRLAVISTGFHAASVRRLLRSIRVP